MIMKNNNYLFQDWLDQNDHVDSLKEKEHVLKLFAIPQSDTDSSVSGQNSIGAGDQAQAQSEAGVDLDKAIKDGKKDTVIEILTNSTGNAVSSILGLAQSRSNWNPLNPDSAKNQEGFQVFVSELLKVPIFNITQSSTTDVKYKEENYNSLIDKVVDLYDGIVEKDKTQIKNSIVNLAKACSSRVNTQNTKTLFVQNTLNAQKGENIVVGLQQTFMMMERSHATGKGAPKDSYKTEISVKTLELTFQSNLWNKQLATGLAGKFVKSWDDWLNGGTTPPAATEKSIDFCFGDKKLESNF